MAAVYDYVFDINLETGNYELLAANNKVPCIVKMYGKYEDILQHVDEYIYSDFIEQFKTIFSLENMRLGLACEMEFLTFQGTEHRWKLRQSFPYTQKNGSRHMLSVTHDIHNAKIASLRKVQEESNIQVALRNSYSRIYLLDLQDKKFSCLFINDLIKPVSLCERFDEDLKTLGEMVVHPEDRTAFYSFYSIQSIQKALDKKLKLTIEYRCQDAQGEYKWFSTCIEPLPYTTTKAMVLVRDITERRKLEAAQRDLEMRYAMVFRQSCDTCFEIMLNTGTYKRTGFTYSEFDNLPKQGDYATLLNEFILPILQPEDNKPFLQTFSLESLHLAYKKQYKDIVVQYRLYHKQKKCLFWKEGRLFFLNEQDGPLAFILVHDITHQKNLELQKNDDEQRFNLAIRNTYCEIYEIDLQTGGWTRCFSSGQLPLIPECPIEVIAEKYIHPEDREHFLSLYSLSSMQKRLQRDFRGDTTDEYRRLGANGMYHWLNATMVAMPSSSGIISKSLLLIRDVTERKEQEQRQRIAEQYDRALRNIYDFMYELNISNNTYKIIYYVKNKYVIPAEQGALSSLLPFMAEHTIHPEDKERFLDSFNLDRINNYFSGDGECIIGEFRKLCVDGSYRWSSLTLFPVSSSETEQKIFLVFAMDISDKKEAEEIAQQNAILALQRLDDERYRTIIEQTDTLVFEWWEGGKEQYVAPALAQRFVGNYDNRELFQIWREDNTLQEEDADKLDALIANLQAGEKHAEMTVRLCKRTGEKTWCRVAVSCTTEAEHLPKRYIGTVNDVDAATKSLNELRFRSEYDVLTKIYNMSAFYAHASATLLHNTEAQYYIVRMDIERFKIINDLYGLTEGDNLLKYIADLLKKIPTSICGRISGDIFCMLLEGTQKSVVQCITSLIEQLTLYSLPYKIKAAFGICPVLNKETPINVMCDWANLALKTVKGSYLYSYAFYDGTLREKILDEKRIENQMHYALHEGQFLLYLQPKVHIPSSRIIGAEGLVRWQHPIEGLIAPNRFVPLFEKNGFILQLDEYIWEQTCITLRCWLDQGLTPPPISVNMSRTHIHDPLLQKKLQNLMDKYNLPMGLLQLEVTESVFLDNESDLYETMNTLRKQGFLFSMDDFGSGYSSLNMLKNIPVDFIKIDREFLNEVTATERGKTVIRYSIAMAHEMKIGVIAEGVETTQQAAFLLQAGCAYAQGFLYSQPLPVAEFEKLAFGAQPPFPVDASILALASKEAKKLMP
jgi:diguanylate cyclase (GGDEF)-like protein/PAS domain S-box-containing protein